jgi:hypothetical protein
MSRLSAKIKIAMKKFIFSVVFCLAICGLTFAQSRLPELDKIKQIKLLESTREDVRRILKDYKLNDDYERRHYERFTSAGAEIRITYSNGKCSDERDEDWNVSEWKVISIYISLNEPVKAKDFGIDLSNYKKERIYANLKHTFKYHQKARGIGYNVNEDGIYGITLIPSKENYSLLCDVESVKKYYESNRWFTDKLRYRIKEPWWDQFANVTELILSKNEITADCPAQDSSETKRDDDYFKISIETKAESNDPTDVLTYNYLVSGGKIIGQGAKNVIWDLSGVKPGSYSITAGVDNGCGACGATKTVTVVVKEPDCVKPAPK